MLLTNVLSTMGTRNCRPASFISWAVKLPMILSHPRFFCALTHEIPGPHHHTQRRTMNSERLQVAAAGRTTVLLMPLDLFERTPICPSFGFSLTHILWTTKSMQIGIPMKPPQIPPIEGEITNKIRKLPMCRYAPSVCVGIVGKCDDQNRYYFEYGLCR